MRKTVLHGSHIGESAAGIAYGKFCPRLTPEEKQPGILLLGVSRFFFLCVDVVKHGIPCQRMLLQIINDFNRFTGVYIVVPGKTQISQCAAAVIAAVYRKNQPPVFFEGRIVYDVLYFGICCKGCAICLRVLRGLWGLRDL